MRTLVAWLRANPLGPVLTVTLSGLLAVFALPQITLWLLTAPKLMLAEVLLGVWFVPYAVYRVHYVPWKPLVGLWALIFVAALLRAPAPLKTMRALAIGAHMSGWFLLGLLLTAGLGLLLMPRRPPAPESHPSIYDKISRAS